MSSRYLNADEVDLPALPPQFVQSGHCLWCNKPLTGRATKYCRQSPNDIYSNMSDCAAFFFDYWYRKPKFKRAVFLRDNFTCQECGYQQVSEGRPWLPDLTNLECDHIIPLAKGGPTELANLQTLCTPCNRKKASSIPSGEAREISRAKTGSSRCPECRGRSYRILSWDRPDYYDPLMLKVACSRRLVPSLA